MIDFELSEQQTALRDGGLGFTHETVVGQIATEIRAFRIYDGPSEVHRWSIARQLGRR